MGSEMILQAMQEIYESDNLWKYYENRLATGTVNPFSDFLESKNAKKFIEAYLQVSQKGTSPLVKKSYIDILKKKAAHSVFIFFLGIYLYEKCDTIKGAIDAVINKFQNDFNDKIGIRFNYLWFLICFFHDIADNYEDGKFAFITSENHISPFINQDLKIPPFLHEPTPKMYKDILSKYFNYRQSTSIIDHGILGGLIFYNDRKKQYEKLKRDGKRGTEPFIKNGVNWSKELVENVHGYVAWTIIAHNMWYIFKGDEDFDIKNEIYKKYGLDELINPVEPKIKLQEHPFLSLLCIVDTIDPVKFLSKCKEKDDSIEIKDILEKISICVDDQNINIELGELNGLDLIKNACTLEKWIDFKNLTITINNKGK